MTQLHFPLGVFGENCLWLTLCRVRQEWFHDGHSLSQQQSWNYSLGIQLPSPWLYVTHTCLSLSKVLLKADTAPCLCMWQVLKRFLKTHIKSQIKKTCYKNGFCCRMRRTFERYRCGKLMAVSILPSVTRTEFDIWSLLAVVGYLFSVLNQF